MNYYKSLFYSFFIALILGLSFSHELSHATPPTSNLIMVFPMYAPHPHFKEGIVEVRIYEEKKGDYDLMEKELTSPGSAATRKGEPSLNIEMDIQNQMGEIRTVNSQQVYAKSNGTGFVTGFYGFILTVNNKTIKMDWILSTPIGEQNRIEISDRNPNPNQRYRVAGTSGFFSISEVRALAEIRNKERNVILRYSLNSPVKNGIQEVILKELTPGAYDALIETLKAGGSSGVFNTQDQFEIEFKALIHNLEVLYISRVVDLKVDGSRIVGLFGNEMTPSSQRGARPEAIDWGVIFSGPGYVAYISHRNREVPVLNGYASAAAPPIFSFAPEGKVLAKKTCKSLLK